MIAAGVIIGVVGFVVWGGALLVDTLWVTK